MSKGVSELIEILIIVIVTVVSVFLLSSKFLFGYSGLSNLYLRRTNFERVEDAVIQIYNSKISGTDKTLAQMLLDRALTNQNPVSYGLGFGNIDVDKQLDTFLSYYFGKDWYLEVPSEKYKLGNPNVDKNVVITYVINLPSPHSDKTIQAFLYVW